MKLPYYWINNSGGRFGHGLGNAGPTRLANQDSLERVGSLFMRKFASSGQSKNRGASTPLELTTNRIGGFGYRSDRMEAEHLAADAFGNNPSKIQQDFLQQ